MAVIWAHPTTERRKPKLPDQYLVYLKSTQTGDLFMAHVKGDDELWFQANGHDDQGRTNWTPMPPWGWKRLARLQFRNQVTRREVAL